MIEKIYKYALSDDKTIEKVIDDDNAAINHVVLPEGDALPEHYSNSNVYMIVARGEISLVLNEQQEHSYKAGKIIVIPYKTKMNVSNKNREPAEIFIVKSPSPKMMKNN